MLIDRCLTQAAGLRWRLLGLIHCLDLLNWTSSPHSVCVSVRALLVPFKAILMDYLRNIMACCVVHTVPDVLPFW